VLAVVIGLVVVFFVTTDFITRPVVVPVRGLPQGVTTKLTTRIVLFACSGWPWA